MTGPSSLPPPSKGTLLNPLKPFGRRFSKVVGSPQTRTEKKRSGSRPGLRSHREEQRMRKFLVMAGLLLSLVESTQVFSQSTYATVSGTVGDSSGAVLPGVSVTGTNNATGVVTTVITNEAGVYTFVGL